MPATGIVGRVCRNTQYQVCCGHLRRTRCQSPSGVCAERKERQSTEKTNARHAAKGLLVGRVATRSTRPPPLMECGLLLRALALSALPRSSRAARRKL